MVSYKDVFRSSIVESMGWQMGLRAFWGNYVDYEKYIVY